MRRIYKNGFTLLLLFCVMMFTVSTAALEEADMDSDLLFDMLSEMPPEEEPAVEEEQSDASDKPDFDEGLIIDFEDEAEIWDDEPDAAQTEEMAEAEETATEEFETEETETEETETEETEDLLFEEEESGSEESTELAAGEYNLWIMGVRVTSENRDKLFDGDPVLEDKFYFTGKTLTFTGNLDYSYDGTIIDNGIDGLEIQVPKGVTVQLHSSSGSVIKSSKSMTIEGRGSLTLTANMASGSCGIVLTDDGKLTINNCSLNVTAPWGITQNYDIECSLEINNANIKVNSNRGAICDFEDGITLNGCVLRSPADGIYNKERGSFVSSSGYTLKELEIGLPNGGYPIWLGNTQVTNLNKDDILGDGGKAKYDPATKTLTLNNPAIKGSYLWNANQGEHFDTLIFVENTDLTIKGSLTASSNTYDVIYVENGNLTLNNTNLTLKLPKPASGKFGSVVKGIGNLTIQGGTVRLIGEDNSNVWYNCTYGLEWYGIVTLNGGTLELTSGRSFAQIFNVNGGTVKFRGMYFACDHEITLNNAVLTAVGDPTGMGLTTNKALITNSTVTFGNGYLHSYMDFTISGSKVSITSPDYVPGILSNYDCITIDGSTVTAKGSEGITAKKTISIQNSTVNAVGTTTHGIFGNGTDKIEVKGDTCTITAQGPKGAMVAAGISINAYHGITTPAGGKLGDAAGGQTVYDGSNVATKVVIQYKRADYSKVDAALKKIPADLSRYTDASVKKVTDAKNAVKRGYNITKQSQVDAMAAAIENAVKGLVKKPTAPAKVQLIAAYNGAHGIGVKWIKLAGATEYTIWQKYQGVWRSIKTVKPNDSSLQVSGNTLMYTDRAVKTGYGKGYIYSVSAKVGNTAVDYDRTGVAIYRLNPPALKKITNPKAGQVTVTWKGVFGRTETNGAYDLQYATEANAKAGKFTSVKKLPGYAHNVTSATVTGLKKGTKYVFRIRCSKTNKDRGTFYSEYSPWLSVTVKK